MPEGSTQTGSGYTNRVAMKIGGRITEVYLGGELACISTSGEFDLPLFTVNAPDRMGFRTNYAGTVRIGPEKSPGVYRRREHRRGSRRSIENPPL